MVSTRSHICHIYACDARLELPSRARVHNSLVHVSPMDANPRTYPRNGSGKLPPCTTSNMVLEKLVLQLRRQTTNIEVT